MCLQKERAENLHKCVGVVFKILKNGSELVGLGYRV